MLSRLLRTQPPDQMRSCYTVHEDYPHKYIRTCRYIIPWTCTIVCALYFDIPKVAKQTIKISQPVRMIFKKYGMVISCNLAICFDTSIPSNSLHVSSITPPIHEIITRVTCEATCRKPTVSCQRCGQTSLPTEICPRSCLAVAKTTVGDWTEKQETSK